MTNKKKKPIPISVEQSKLLGNMLRVKIISVLLKTPKTSKQVATEIGESPGNVHYHIQKLYQGKLIDLVEEKQVGGVIEKYYLARGSTFESPEGIFPELSPGFNAALSISSSSALYLNDKDRETLLQEFRELMEKWVIKTSKADYGEAEEYVIGLNLVSRKEKNEDENKKESRKRDENI